MTCDLDGLNTISVLLSSRDIIITPEDSIGKAYVVRANFLCNGVEYFDWKCVFNVSCNLIWSSGSSNKILLGSWSMPVVIQKNVKSMSANPMKRFRSHYLSSSCFYFNYMDYQLIYNVCSIIFTKYLCYNFSLKVLRNKFQFNVFFNSI